MWLHCTHQRSVWYDGSEIGSAGLGALCDMSQYRLMIPDLACYLRRIVCVYIFVMA